ncbi:hypothetical protein PK28_00440 [Hymenobacter sp. DG25B]|jgi:hypothetical protein|uniref:hypothetical protein n=1 Tax=Hymenobacter sp. DG25B TaxID=1385664 RepID=UPI0005411A51|nr:hypothetical protein [Hymenobacter sp. DG25B]AIZ62541.1 hypothetical protein PK28_00440 [Hymenobacter sp. DG25B]
MGRFLLFFSIIGLLFSCSSASETSSSKRNQGPVAHNTIVDCVLYDGMSKTSKELVKLSPETEVQVTDTVDYYFMKVRVVKDGQTYNGYLHRNCFGM